MQACESCLVKLAEVCAGSKKNRKAAFTEGVFKAMSECLRRYEEVGEAENAAALMRIKCCMAIAAMCKKAEAEGLQEGAQVVMFQLVATINTMMKPALQAVQGITRNHKENTVKLVRAGGRVAWLDPESSIVPPDE